MEGILNPLILGVVQGLTEFLPISSSGHLLIAREILGLNTEYGLGMDALLHLATALAVFIYFRKDWVRLIKSTLSYMQGKGIDRIDKVLIWALTLGTIPGVFFGLLFENFIENQFRSVELVAYALIGGSILFLTAELLGKQSGELSVKKGWWIGFFQALALIPGVSRSGATISGGLLFGLSRAEAARFAFLLSMPIIIGAGSKKFLDLEHAGVLVDSFAPLMISAIAAFASGMAAIHFLLKYLRTHSLGIFIVYRIALAILILFLI